MGTTVQVIATGGDGAPQAAVDLAVDRSLATIDALERRWSRFLADSELSRLNAEADGRPKAVSGPTATLVARGIEGWQRTGGRFDPSVLRAVIAAGYDRDIASIDGAGVPVGPKLILPDELDAGCAGMSVDAERSAVILPAGVGFDPGGLGKGLAADLVAEAGLAQPGVAGILVNLGGDLRCLGRPPVAGDGAWVVGLPDPVDGSAGRGRVGRLRLADGAVATSTCRRRRWRTPGGEAHHLIDPTTGRPSEQAATAVTVIAGEACDAEILATAVAADGRLPDDRAMLGGAVVIVDRADGRRQVHGPLDRYRA